MTTSQCLEGLHIVLVDDEPGVLRALTLLLSAARARVTPFSSPPAFLEWIEAGGSAHAIVSDLRMPEMSGIELLCALRFKGCDTPFILMSGHASAAEVASAKQATLAAFLPKPFAPQQLIELLGQISPELRKRAANDR